MNLYNSKKLKTLKSKKLTLKGGVGGPSGTSGKRSILSSHPSGVKLFAQIKAEKKAAEAAAAAESHNALDNNTSGVSSPGTSSVETNNRPPPKQAKLNPVLTPKFNICEIISKKNRRVSKSQNIPIAQEESAISIHSLPTLTTDYTALNIFDSTNEYENIELNQTVVDYLINDNINLYYSYDTLSKSSGPSGPVSRQSSAMNTQQPSFYAAALEKTRKGGPGPGFRSGQRFKSGQPSKRGPGSKTAKKIPMNPSGYTAASKLEIKRISAVESMVADHLFKLLQQYFFIYENHNGNNDNCESNVITGIRVFNLINNVSLHASYSEKRISPLALNKKIILVDYENYRIGLEKIYDYKDNKNTSYSLGLNNFNDKIICNKYPDTLFIFIKTKNYVQFELYKIVETDPNYKNLIIINTFGRLNQPMHRFSSPSKLYTNTPGKKRNYLSTMTDDYLLVQLYQYLKNKGFDVSVISRDKYKIYPGEKLPPFDIFQYKYDVHSIPSSFSITDYIVTKFEEYPNALNDLNKITHNITNYLHTQTSISNYNPSTIRNIHTIISTIKKDINKRLTNSYHYLLLFLYIIQN